MSISIRFATPQDAETLYEFICGLADYENECDAIETSSETLRGQLQGEHPPFECLLAEQAGVAVGFALFFQTYSTWRGVPGLYLEDLFVPIQRRGQGVGQALLTRLAKVTVERGFARLEWAVLNWNEPAIGFYKQLGAKPQDEWTTYRLDREALSQLAGSEVQRE